MSTRASFAVITLAVLCAPFAAAQTQQWLPAGYGGGFLIDGFVVEPPRYLAWLTSRLDDLEVPLRIADLADLADVDARTGYQSGANLVFAYEPTITRPTIASFTNAQHDHTGAGSGALFVAT